MAAPVSAATTHPPLHRAGTSRSAHLREVVEAEDVDGGVGVGAGVADLGLAAGQGLGGVLTQLNKRRADWRIGGPAERRRREAVEQHQGGFGVVHRFAMNVAGAERRNRGQRP